MTAFRKQSSQRTKWVGEMKKVRFPVCSAKLKQEGQDARAAGVQPVARVGGIVAGSEAGPDGFRGVDVVGGVCCVWDGFV